MNSIFGKEGEEVFGHKLVFAFKDSLYGVSVIHIGYTEVKGFLVLFVSPIYECRNAPKLR